MMKKIWKFVTVVCFLGMLVGCGGNQLENFTEEQLHEESVKVIDLFNQKEYDAVADLFEDSLKDNISGAQLKQAWDENFSEVGDFVEYSNFTYAEKNKNGFVEVTAKYQNNNVKYTISFDKEMRLTNFFLK